MKAFSAINVKTDSNISQPDLLELIKFLEDYVEVFTDPFLTKIHAAVIASSFISKDRVDIVEKRKDAISKNEIANPMIYVQKYWEILLTLHHAIEEDKDPDKNQKRVSLKEFYFKFGYLTEKQINMIKYITPKDTRSKLRKRIDECRFEPPSVSYILEGILAKIHKNISLNFKELEKYQDLVCRLLKEYTSSIKTEQTIEKQKEEAQTVPQAFLSLSEMRKALQYVT